MKTTVVLSDDLFRRAKAAAAMRGRKFKDLVAEGLQRVLDSPDEAPPPPRRPQTVHELMQECCGVVDSGRSDLATNPDHLKEFGSASMGSG